MIAEGHEMPVTGGDPNWLSMGTADTFRRSGAPKFFMDKPARLAWFVRP